MITAEEVALLLGVSRGTVYDLAAPKGPIPCVRLGRRCLRFDIVDVEAYVQKCRHVEVVPHVDVKASRSRVNIRKSKPLNCFERLGIKVLPKPTR